MMTVGDLLDLLDGLDEETEVRLAQQPSYPFEYELSDGVVVELGKEDILYLIEGNQIGYLPDEARDTIGWNN